LNDSENRFSHGDPDSIYTVLVVVLVLASDQLLNALAMNSKPMSLRMNAVPNKGW
jgi:hypothetical protein